MAEYLKTGAAEERRTEVMVAPTLNGPRMKCDSHGDASDWSPTLGR